MRPILIVGVLFFTALTFYSALWFKSEDIEADITTRVTEDLDATDAKNIDIDVDGRHVTLSGIVYDTATETAYLDTANETYGALGPIDGLTVPNGSGFLKAVKSPEGITLTGAVPSDAARTALLEAATTSTNGDVVDAMTVGAAAGAWTDEAGFGLGQMALLKEGALSVAPDSYTLSGVTEGSADDVSAPLADRAGWQSFVSTPLVATGLSAELDAVKGQVTDLEGTVGTLEGVVAERDSTITTLTAERDTLATSLTDMTQARDSALEQRDTTTADVIAERDTLAQRFTALSGARDVLSQTVTGLASDRDGLEQSVATITEERDGLAQKLSGVNAARDVLSETVTGLASEREGLEQTVATLTDERDGLAQKLTGISAARDVLSETVTGLASEREGLEQSVATLTEERDTAVTDLDALRASLNDTQSSTAALRGELSETKAQLAERDTTIDGLNAEVADLNGQLETQVASLNSGQQEDAALRAQIDAQTGTIEELTANVDARGNTIVRLQGELDATDEAKEAAMAQVTDLNAQLANQSETGTQAAAQVATLTGQIAELQTKGDEMATEVTELTALVAERDATIADLRNVAPLSTSANAPADTSQMAAQCGARAGDILETAQINFSSGTANLRSTSVETLERLTGIALACADSGLSVEIGGHTDSQGSDESNQNLSERRAQAVAQFMVDRGVPADTLSPVGFGEAQPIGDNDTVLGRQQNRRISFEWQAR